MSILGRGTTLWYWFIIEHGGRLTQHQSYFTGGKIMNRILLLLITLAFSAQAPAWTVKRGFEDGAPGVKAQTPDSFNGTAGRSSFTSNQAIVLNGNLSGTVTVNQGETGFGQWGGSFNFPTALKEGQEIWFRVYVMYPTGWDFSCGGCTQGMKFMRIHTASSGGSNEGYMDTLINGDTTGGKIMVGNEALGPIFFSNNGGGTKYRGTAIIRDKWYAYEQYLKWSSVPGQGIYRVWQDGNLIFEDLKTATLRSSTSKSDFIYLYTYWNNGAPQTQTSYVDEVVITSDTPPNRDAQGNPLIGVSSNYTYIAPPNPPVIQ
jgi:hypothetical protein